MVNSEFFHFSPDGAPAVRMSAVTGCKLARWIWNKNESQIFFSIFYFHLHQISHIRWTLKMIYVLQHLEVLYIVENLGTYMYCHKVVEYGERIRLSTKAIMIEYHKHVCSMLIPAVVLILDPIWIKAKLKMNKGVGLIHHRLSKLLPDGNVLAY